MKKLLKLMMLAVMVSAFSSCSDDDEPEAADNTAKVQYENIVNMVYDTDGLPRYTPSNHDGIYLAVAADDEVSHHYVEKVIGKNWDGKQTTIDLGEYGTVKLNGNNPELTAEGIYDEFTVNVKDYTPFTLKIFDKARANDDNGYTSGGVVLIEIH